MSGALDPLVMLLWPCKYAQFLSFQAGNNELELCHSCQ